MKVLHFFKTYWPDTFGGIERTIHAISKGVQKHGIQSEVLTLSRTPEANSIAFEDHFAHKAKLDFEFASTGFSRAVFSRFKQLSREADIVHFHFPWPMMDVVHFVTSNRKPAIVTYHSDIVKQKALLRLYEPLMFRFLGDMDSIVATSPNYLQSSPVLQKFRSKVEVIPLGLDEASYAPVEHSMREKWRAKLPPRFFLFVGVLRYYKGIHILMDAAEKNGIEIVMIGDGDAGNFQQEAQSRGINNMHFLGSLPDEDKMAILDLSIGLVFPSHLRSEAFGLSLVEAAMRGKPMISCEIGTGTSYVNLHGSTGLVIPPNDKDALAAAMLRLMDDDALAQEFGRNARQRYVENFTAQRMADSYASLYRRILQEKEGAGR
ncbi:glycosyltransferase [Neorhizobium sp. T786]|uniref:glycosyltransferase n=1 Tax=Pseudorhizobium xiangyangii TaxID=2883104 RepID=UPI001CFF5E5A|nr:glycosyltransferase [Neorhizobium xiangyangii]MCB5204835.1 glycosyltransferase [Neorhizobium xiangyangii]